MLIFLNDKICLQQIVCILILKKIFIYQYTRWYIVINTYLYNQTFFFFKLNKNVWKKLDYYKFCISNVKKLEYVEIEKKDIYYIFLIIEINRVIIQNWNSLI